MPNREAEGLYAEFHFHPVLQVEESHKQGREVYKDEVYVQIQIKGQKNQIRDRKMRPEDRTDFPSAWVRWSEKEHAAKTGTPITAIPGIGPSMELELAALGLRTVEDMASLNDAGCQNMRGGYMFRERARAYLKALEVKPEPVAPAVVNENPVDESVLTDPNVVSRAAEAPKRRGRPPKKVAA